MAQLGADLSAKAETLSHILGLMQAFSAFDSDNDGHITVAELAALVGSLGYKLTDGEVRSMMSQADTNKDGRLNLAEFLELNTKEMELGSFGMLLKNVFESIDADGDEIVTGEEMYQSIRDMGLCFSLQDCHDIVASIDRNGDGAVTSQEFKLLIESLI